MTSHKGEGGKAKCDLMAKGCKRGARGSKNCVTSFMNGPDCFAECTNLSAIMDVSQLLIN